MYFFVIYVCISLSFIVHICVFFYFVVVVVIYGYVCALSFVFMCAFLLLSFVFIGVFFGHLCLFISL